VTGGGNPLLAPAGTLPAFGAVRAEHVVPAVTELLAACEQGLERACDDAVPPDYEALSATLGVPLERLQTAWGAVSHLNAVADTPELRAAYNAALTPVVAFFTRLGADERLFARVQAIASNGCGLGTPERRRAVELQLQDFKLSGAMLRGPSKARFEQIRARLAELSQSFSEHVLDATDRFGIDLVDEARLAGLPADNRAAARAAAQRAGFDGWRLTLQGPMYLPAMQQLQDRDLRRALHTAYVSRASDLGPAELDNSAAMAEILALRQEEARLLGHPDYAALSLVPKMASSAAQVLGFLRDLARRARPHAQQELAELSEFAARHLGIDVLQPWDVLFATERLREARYAFSQDEVKAYFTLPRVLDGLLGVIEALFGVGFEPEASPAGLEGVLALRVVRRADLAREEVAHLLLDLHARPGKRPGAWMAGARSRWARPDAGGRVQTPVAHLVCNFASGQDGRPALLTHGDVLTLLHEFGHGLHHVLTRSRELATSGTAGVEWDAIELPSLFMENLGWEWDVLRRMSAHAETGEPLPRALFERMLAARNFQGGIGLLRQLEYSLFDMRAHAEPGNEQRVQEIADEAYREAGVLPRNPDDRYPAAFLHLFAGGYAAGYYSYKWAEVLSSDAWSAFAEAGVLDAETGARYRREILETGGSRPAMDSFRAFRGREPRIDALLLRLGLEQTATPSTPPPTR